jgi:ATP-dependent Clp protease ATP-binding subunit ClpC
MNGYNFTERVRKVLTFARADADAMRHEFVGTEHILLGLIRDGGGVGHAALQNLVGDADGLRQRLLERMPPPGAGKPTGADLPYTARAKKALEFAMHEAREFKHSYVGTEHLLLGLVRDTRGLASEVLAEAGADLEATRAEILRLLGTAPEWGADPLIGETGEEAPIPIQRCVDCGVEMERGCLFAGAFGPGAPMQWAREAPPRSWWSDPDHGAVAAFRCPKCGLLRLITPQA